MKISNQQLYSFLFLVTAIKIFFSFFLELGNDESYYFTYALKPQLNYFDHPLMVGILIRLSTFNLLFVNDVMIRLGPTICCFLASIFIFKIGKLLFDKQVGWYAVLLYNFSVYTTIIAGWFIMPDSTQLLFWCAALYIMCKLIFEDKEKLIKFWLLLGVLIGLATLSKVHALYLWGGFSLFIIFYKTKWLLNWRLYVSVLTTLIFLLPLLIWNIQNKFITYTFHSARIIKTQINFESLLREIVGEALYQNPIIFILILISLIFVIRKIKENNVDKMKFHFLLLMSLPMIIMFWGVSLFNEIFPHWSGPAYIPLLILAGYYLSKKSKNIFPNWVKLSCALVLFAFISITILANFAPFNLGSQHKKNYGEYCPTLDISGWKDFSNDFKKIVTEDFSSGNMKQNSSIIINKWFPACQLELYTSRKTKLPIYAIGDLENVHHFAWLNQQRKKPQLSDDAYCIVPSNLPFDVKKEYSNYFTTIESLDTINQIRGHKIVRYFYVWRLKNCKLLSPDILQKITLTK